MSAFQKSLSLLVIVAAVSTALVVRHTMRRQSVVAVHVPAPIRMPADPSTIPTTSTTAREIAPLPRRVIDRQAVRSNALSTATRRLDAAEEEFAKDAEKAADKHLAAIDAFLKSREGGIKPFAERLVSLRGKWVFIKGQFGKDDYSKFISDEFEKNVLKPNELTEVVTKAVAAYLAELAGMENQLLIRLRADLSDADTDMHAVIPSTRSQDAFNARFDRATAQITEIVTRDVQYDVAREVASFIVADLSAKIGLKVMTAVATKLGISSGILATGAASSLATFGIALVACIVFDYLVDQGLKLAGQDAVTKCDQRVKETLGGVVAIIKNGIPEAHNDWKELTYLAEKDPDAKVRDAAAKAAASIAKSGNLGLRRELLQINAVRSAIRKQAIQRLVLEETQ